MRKNLFHLRIFCQLFYKTGLKVDFFSFIIVLFVFVSTLSKIHRFDNRRRIHGPDAELTSRRERHDRFRNSKKPVPRADLGPADFRSRSQFRITAADELNPTDDLSPFLVDPGHALHHLDFCRRAEIADVVRRLRVKRFPCMNVQGSAIIRPAGAVLDQLVPDNPVESSVPMNDQMSPRLLHCQNVDFHFYPPSFIHV